MQITIRPSPSYSITLRLEYSNKAGMLGRIASAIGEAGGDIGAVDIVQILRDRITRDITINAADHRHSQEIIRRLRALPDVRVISVSDRTFLMHIGGKLEVCAKHPLRNRSDLSMAYTPGVGRVCLEVVDNPASVFNLTIKRNTIAIITDGSAVLGLGNLGPYGALPVMEGKAMIFKEFAGVDAFPICLDTHDPDEIVETTVRIAPVFGGINLEDIAAPNCFYIEERLRERLDIPVFHDDQHGTSVVVLAALYNALKIVGKRLTEIKVVINGAGAAATATAKLLLRVGVPDIILCDRVGAIHRGREQGMNSMKEWLAANTNPNGVQGSVREAIVGADVFIGLSGPGILHAEDIQAMGRDPIVFAMANPDPEIMPEEAAPYARVIATGRSDYPNQINNALGFPGIFRGLLDCHARQVNDEMKLAAAKAIADIIKPKELNEDYIIPSIFDKRVVPAVSQAMVRAARQTGTARRLPKHLSYAH